MIALRSAAVALLLLACSAQAQLIPTPYASARTSGKVVDADSGQPIEGAVVLARWEWLNYTPPAFHSSGGYANAGHVVHAGESVTGRDGGYAIPAWGPAIRAGGKMEDGAPDLLAFKTGYEPLHRITQPRDDGLIRLKKSAGDAKAYAQRIAEFQGRMHWLQSEDWALEGAMVLALHREKARLGVDGDAILGAHRMPNRAGKGTIVDAATRKEGPGGVIWVEWTMRRSDGGAGTRRVVQTLRPPGYGAGSTFFVSPWRLPGPSVAGWVIDPTVKPTVRVYPYGAKRSAAVTWVEEGGTVTVEKLDQTKEALLAELQARRRDIDGQIATGNRAEALVLLGPLLDQLDHDCRRLTPDLQANLCFDPASDVGRAIVAARTQSIDRVEEGENGLKIVTRVQAAGGGTAAAAVASTPGAPQAARRVGGFTIEPIR
jgi:hypothetical protein